MADPITISTAIAVGSAATSALGSFLGGNATYEANKYKAGVARANQQIAKQNAEYSLRVGEVQAQTEGMKTRFQMGQTKAIQAGRGIDVGSGSALAVRESEHDIGLHDQATIRANAARTAYGHEVQAMEKGAQAELYTMAGESAKTASYIDAASSILGAASSVSDKWIKAKQVGLPNFGAASSSAIY